MANSGPNTNSSQFFITLSPRSEFDGKYTVFGKMISGWETLSQLEEEAVDNRYRPVKPIKIQNVTIHANPLAI
jgi:peptidyl-prolyl cis-trans isomerase-like 3